MRTLSFLTVACCLFVACGTTLIAAKSGYSQTQVELTTNGDFETGDTSDWLDFPTGGSSFLAVDAPAADVFAGSFSGMIENTAEASNAFVRQANIGIGIVQPSTQVNISFWAKGSGEAGGVQFAEFFSEAEQGVSSTEILGGAPLFLTDTYEFYEFTVMTGSDVTNGVTLQMGATTGANIGSEATFFFDDVSVTTLGDGAGVQGDFNGDGDVDGDDVDFYIGQLDQAATGTLAQLDLDGSGTVTLDDHNFHVTTLVQTSNGVTGALLGDVNLDGEVDVLNDAFALVAGLGQPATSRAQGDLDADGDVTVLGDAFILVSQLGQSN